MASNVQPIIVKKIKKGGHGHHGGAWKVAYADFVTAMMAFFLLLWLLNATTEEQRQGIADYFTPTSVSTATSGAGGMLGGTSMSPEGAMQSRSSVPSVSLRLRPTSGASATDGEDEGGDDAEKGTGELSEEEFEEEQRRRDQEQFDQATEDIKEALESTPELQKLAENLVIDQTPEGLRIQIIDREGQPMFPSGSARLLPHTVKLMQKISQVIAKTKKKIAISGHTDATPFRGPQAGFGNWELSTTRALASRRVLVESGFSQDRIARVTGKAETEPLMKEDPTAPQNRRISIVLLRKVRPPAAAGDSADAGDRARSSGRGTAPAEPKPKAFEKDWTGPRLR